MVVIEKKLKREKKHNEKFLGNNSVHRCLIQAFHVSGGITMTKHNEERKDKGKDRTEKGQRSATKRKKVLK